jgi:predicted PurR-regulated permease PerM
MIILVATILVQIFGQWLSIYGDFILLFLLGWLVSFILNPAVNFLSEHPLPEMLSPWFTSRSHNPAINPNQPMRLSRSTAVILVYVILLLLVIVMVALMVPPLIAQSTQLIANTPEYVAQLPAASDWAQKQLNRMGVRVNVEDTLRGVLANVQGYTATLLQNALQVFTGILGFLGNLFFVLIIGFIITMDGPRLWRRIMRQVPKDYNDELRFFAESVDRTFGGFIRGQLFQSVLIGIGTAIVMTLFSLDFVLVASLFSLLFMLIPLIGAFLAFLPPVLVVLFQSPELTLWVIIILFLYQFVIVNVLMPRVLSNSLGLHPLLVFAAILLSGKIAGFWGAFFGIPVAGVLWAMGTFFLDEYHKDQEVQAHLRENSD